MVRAIYTGSEWLGVYIESVEDDMENIDTYVREGTPVIIVEDESNFENMGIEVEMLIE